MGQYTIYCPALLHNYPDYAMRAGISQDAALHSISSSDSDTMDDFKSSNSDLEELDEYVFASIISGFRIILHCIMRQLPIPE